MFKKHVQFFELKKFCTPEKMETKMIINPSLIEANNTLDKNGLHQNSRQVRSLSNENRTGLLFNQEFHHQHYATNKNKLVAKKMSLPAITSDRQHSNPSFNRQNYYQTRFIKVNETSDKKRSLSTISVKDAERRQSIGQNYFDDDVMPKKVSLPRVLEKTESANSVVYRMQSETLSVVGQQCLIRWKTFARETTVHGVWHAIRGDRHWLSRLFWAVAFASCFLVCCFFITESMIRYMSYGVKTTTSLQTESEIEFPAVTLCNENFGRKSLVGANEVLLKSLAATLVDSREGYLEKLGQAMVTCKGGDGIRTVANDSLAQLLKFGYESLRQLGIAKSFQLLSPDSFYSMIECRWKSRRLNCSELFLNHITDLGWCFTINAHPEVIKGYSLGLSPLDTAYGVTKNNTLLKLVSGGPRNNLRLLMNLRQDDYCLTRHNTAGFQALIHNSRVQPLFFLDSPIALPPGYETHVAIRFHRIVKTTSSLGRCTDFKRLGFSPNATIYFKETCYLECFSRRVYETCNCTPGYSPPRSNYILAKELGLKYVNLCFSESILCMSRFEREFLETGLNENCGFCTDPCAETKYSYQISLSYFPTVGSFELYANFSQTQTLEQMRRNYVSADFYVETMLMDVVTEAQAVTLDQLVADMGGQLGFLLGMSVLSLFEFVQFIMPKKRARRLRQINYKMNNLKI